MIDLRDLYQEVILDHNRRPRNFGAPAGRQPPGGGAQPALRRPGDGLPGPRQDGRIQDVAFQGAGCAISTASASLMTEALKGRTVEEARGLFQGFHGLVTTGAARGLGGAGQARRVRRRARVPDAGQVRHPRLAHPAGGARRRRTASRSRRNRTMKTAGSNDMDHGKLPRPPRGYRLRPPPILPISRTASSRP